MVDQYVKKRLALRVDTLAEHVVLGGGVYG